MQQNPDPRSWPATLRAGRAMKGSVWLSDPQRYQIRNNMKTSRFPALLNKPGRGHGGYRPASASWRGTRASPCRWAITKPCPRTPRGRWRRYANACSRPRIASTAVVASTSRLSDESTRPVSSIFVAAGFPARSDPPQAANKSGGAAVIDPVGEPRPNGLGRHPPGALMDQRVAVETEIEPRASAD